MHGHVAPQIRSSSPLGRVSPDEDIRLSFLVRLDQKLLDQTLAQIYQSTSAAGRHYLSPEEFARKCGLAEKRRRLKDFAQAHGLSVDNGDEPHSLVIKVHGSASRVEKAFEVRLNRYRHVDGQVFHAHEAEPTIPAALAEHLGAVAGLSNARGIYHSRLRAHPSPIRSGSLVPGAGQALPQFTGTGPGGTLAPADIKSIYGLGSTALTGSGQTIALVELDGYSLNDIQAYRSRYGLSTPVTFVSVDGVSNFCNGVSCDLSTPDTDPDMGEVALDIELAMALAPGAAHILAYTSANSVQNNYDILAQIASENTAKVVSTSWGLDETDIGQAMLTAESVIFAQMAAQGQTFYAAAGDNGSYADRSTLSVSDPASQPYVTGVGGTTLSGTISSPAETVWDTSCVSPGTCEATGGGVSAFWGRPSWQSGVGTSATMRNVPDVALDSDPNTGYGIYVGGAWYLYGGTSAAAPLWASWTALLNEQLAVGGSPTVGFANPTFYSLGKGASYASVFNDVTSGSNGHYSAGAGYDNVTGWGSFKGTALINAFDIPIVAPSGFAAATLGTSSITWTWSSVPNATSYNVYDGIVQTAFLANVSATAYTRTGLSANNTYALSVKGDNAGGEGPGGVSVTTSTLANPIVGTPTITPSLTSLTVNFNPCPASPAASSCEGYILDVSVNAGFSSIVFHSTTTDRTVSQFVATGLSSNTTYYLRLATLNLTQGANFASLGKAATLQAIAAPGQASFTNISSSTVVFNWTRHGNPTNQPYEADCSTMSSFAPLTALQTGNDIFSSTFTSLLPNTTYYFRAYILGSPASTSTVSTLGVAPSLAAAPFSAVWTSSMSVQWSVGVDPSGSLFQAEISSDSGYSSVVSSRTRGVSASFTGLAANKAYYARVWTVGNGGALSATYLAVGSTSTLALPVSLLAQPFSGQGSSGFTGSFTAGNNSSGTQYLAQVSTDPAFSFVFQASVTLNTSAVFTGLASNTSYYLRAAAMNLSGGNTAFTAVLATATLPAPAAALSAVVSTVSVSTIRMAWSANGNPAPTLFLSKISPDAAFASGVLSSTTANTWADFSGLAANTTYYLRVQSLSLSPPNPDSSLADVGAGATLAVPPSAASSPFVSVSYASMTVHWVALPSSPQSASCEGYQVDLATSSDFGGVLYSSITSGSAATSAAVAGLSYGTTYYLRVGALNWNNASNVLAMGSSVTWSAVLSSATVLAGQALSLSLSPPYAAFTAVGLQAPPGVLPTGTAVTINASVVNLLPPPVSNEGIITSVGSSVGLTIAAGGLQPNGNATITMDYDPASLPAGKDPKTLVIMRYDDESSQWVLLPTSVDTTLHRLTALTNHFSTFAPFFVTPASALDSVQIFPIPWKIGSTDGRFNAGVLTFSNLPASASLKLYTITGELLWRGAADSTGVATWTGANDHGGKVASGTYLVVIEGGGQRLTRRVVVIR